MRLHLAQRRRRRRGGSSPRLRNGNIPTPPSSATKRGAATWAPLSLCAASRVAVSPRQRRGAIQLRRGARRRAMATHTVLFGGLETTAFRKGREVARSFCPTFSHFLPQQQKAKAFGEALLFTQQTVMLRIMVQISCLNIVYQGKLLTSVVRFFFFFSWWEFPSLRYLLTIAFKGTETRLLSLLTDLSSLATLSYYIVALRNT